MRVVAFLLVCTGCVTTSKTTSRPSAPVPEPAVTAREVAAFRNSVEVDRLDSLLAAVLSLNAQFVDLGHGFQYTGEPDSSFQRLVHAPESVRRMVDCFGWNKLSAATYDDKRVLVGAVCGIALAATRYVATRSYPLRLSRDLWTSGWGAYRNPSLETMRSAQKAWAAQIRRDPP